MTDDRDNPLLVAVEELTKPQRSKVMQEAVLRTVELPPLLIQLRDAIAGSIGIGGSGSLANERNMLDGDALYRFSLISSTIGDWARMAGSTAAKNDPVATLQSWYVAYTAKPVELDSERFYLRELRSWAGQIRAKLDPPRSKDLPDACPVCEASTWWREGQEYPRPLVVEFRDGPEMINEAKGMCRSCEQVWTARELSYALEAKERGESTA
jgi:hypothetical protein